METFYEKIIKIVILGESSVGKTNLLSRYLDNKFIEDKPATVGVDFLSKEMQIKSKTIKTQFWDTAGQEKYKSISKAYYKLANGIILVYDITNRESFNCIEKWLEEISEICVKIPNILLIGNKSDLNEERNVTENEAKIFSEKKGLFFFETSAKCNFEREVHKAFLVLIEKCWEDLEEMEGRRDEKELKDIKRKNIVIGDSNEVLLEERKWKCC